VDRIKGLPRAALACAAAWLAGCPTGCPKEDPQTIYEGPVEEVPLERTGKCTFRVISPPLKHPYPHRPPDAPYDGAWFRIWNRRDVLGWKDVKYDPVTATFTILEPWCSEGVTSFELSWHSLVRTANE